MSSVRPLLPGRPYAPPPPQSKLPPTELTEYRLREILTEPGPEQLVWRTLVRGLQGISPLLAREISFRVLGDPQARIEQVHHLTPFLETLSVLLSPLETGDWNPTLVIEKGAVVVYAPYPLTHRGDPQPAPSMSQAIEAYTQAVTSQDPYAAAKRPVQQAIEDARERLVHRQKALQRGLERAGQADKWRKWGEWILAYAHQVDSGQQELVAQTGTGPPLTIPLDPAKSAVENAQSYFARYRKAQRAGEQIPARIMRTELTRQYLDQLAIDLELASSRPEIEEVRQALVSTGLRRPKTRKGPRQPQSQPLSLQSPDGLTILVGRNSRQNDEVTFRRSNRDDWWFHARGVPGAHVVVRAEGRALPHDTVRRAAELAAYHSSLQSEGAVDVDYTQRRHVQHIPGAAPGLVTYSEEQTVRVAPRGPKEGT
jgi:predicted ribosome quality control (RQC) complex YloA/Tae2 family protein